MVLTNIQLIFTTNLGNALTWLKWHLHMRANNNYVLPMAILKRQKFFY